MATSRTYRRPFILVLQALAAFLLVFSSGVGATHAATLRASGTLTVNPVRGAAGTTVILSGSGFTAASSTSAPTVSATFTDAAGVRTNLSGTTTTNASGQFQLHATVPSNAATGPGTFSASDSGGGSGTTPFDVKPTTTTLVSSITSGAPGVTTTITGTGYAANEAVTLTFTQGSSVTTYNATPIMTNASGLFTTLVRVPTGASAGSAAFTAQDHDGNTASAPFTVIRAGSPTISAAPTLVSPGGTTTISGTGFVAGTAITLGFTQGSTSATLSSGSVRTDATGSFTSTVTVPTTAVTGTATISAADKTNERASATLSVSSDSNGPTTLYFAEGYTGKASSNGRATFTETLSLLNANAFTATVQITYLVQGGSPVVVTRTIAPNTTLRELVNSDIGADRIAAAIVSSPSRITASRVIDRTDIHGATLDSNSSLGNPNLGKTFYFAEGYTGISFQEYLTLANPGATDAHVTVAFAPEAVSSVGALTETFTVPARGRYTRNIRSDTLRFSNKSVGMIVTSDQPIMAERVLYFGDGYGSAKYGSTTKAGIQTVANQYLFAYGSAGGAGLAQQQGDQSFVTVMNPGTSPVSSTVLAQFYDAGGRSLGTASVTVAPGTRQTIFVNPVVHYTSGVYSVVLTSPTPFVAENPEYYGGSPNVGMHPGIVPSGVPSAVTSAAFPDLTLTDASGGREQQTVFLYNSGSAGITVAATYYASNGNRTTTYSVAPGGITTVNVNSEASGFSGTLGATFVVTSHGTNDAFVATNVASSHDLKSYTGTQGFLFAQ